MFEQTSGVKLPEIKDGCVTAWSVRRTPSEHRISPHRFSYVSSCGRRVTRSSPPGNNWSFVGVFFSLFFSRLTWANGLLMPKHISHDNVVILRPCTRCFSPNTLVCTVLCILVLFFLSSYLYISFSRIISAGSRAIQWHKKTEYIMFTLDLVCLFIALIVEKNKYFNLVLRLTLRWLSQWRVCWFIRLNGTFRQRMIRRLWGLTAAFVSEAWFVTVVRFVRIKLSE